MEEPRRTMTREELHDLVWSMPIQKLAQQYGISDRGLAKTCERHLVPVPGRGYWAKIEAGQRVKKTPLRAVQNTAIHTVHIGTKYISPQSAYIAGVLAAAKVELEREDEEIEKSRPSALPAEPEPVRPAPAAISPAGIHADAKPLLTELRRLEPDRDGFVDLSYIKVSPSDINRVVNLVSALAYRLECYDFELVTERNRLRFAKDGTTIGFSITAPRKRVATKSGWRSYDYLHIGRLVFEIYGGRDGSRKNWSDTDNRKVEEAISEIVEGFRVALIVEREREEKQRIEDARRAHMAHRRELVTLRQKRESDRLSFLHFIAAARREVADLKATIATVPQDGSLPDDYQRMMGWAKRRLDELEAETSIERIQERLVEQRLYTDPDHLFDPEGDPPPKVNFWDD
ncbi:hypothetical protein [Rhizobium leguminosarum]